MAELPLTVARVTLQTIADQVGVSRMTVSNAFSRPDQLSPALRDRILKAADDLGYTGPDPAARALARGTTGAIGVLLTDSLQVGFTDEVATGFLGAIAAALSPSGLALTLLTGGQGGGDVIPARDVAIDGAVIYSCDTASPGTSWLLKRKLPVVFVDQEGGPGQASVNIDDRGGARAAAQHIVDLGHRRISLFAASHDGPFGLFTGEPPAVPGRVATQRMAGWLDALTPAGVVPQVFRGPAYSDGEYRAAARQLLTGPDRPTAIICHSDAIAATVIATAHELGLSIPEDLSVVGFDDSPLAHRLSPPLTTVHQDQRAKGQAAVEALTAQIQGQRTGNAPEHPAVVLPTELVIRSSTAAPAA